MIAVTAPPGLTVASNPQPRARAVLYLGCPMTERAGTERLLAPAHVSPVWVDNAAQVLNELRRREMPVLLDLSRGVHTLQIARDIRAERPSTLMFAVVDELRPDLAIEAVLAGMADVFPRPPGGRRVADAIDHELGHETRTAGHAAASHLYAHAPAMREVMTLCARAAMSRCGVTIHGEDGTGRQVAARAIHEAGSPSGKRNGAFVCVNCAPEEPEQLETMLFGDAPGSPPPELASRGLESISRHSLLYEARDGTLYLQQMSDATARVQARLARVLRDREVVLIETGETIGLDIRPIAGVDPGFEIAVGEGRVREDLERRFAVIRIDMPPLRNRREDIPALTNYLIRDVCLTMGVSPRTLSRPALTLLSALPWRQNVSELQRLLENVVTGVAGGRAISLEDVLAHVRLGSDSAVFETGRTLRQARARFERDYVAAVLKQHRGRIGETAKALGIQRTNLYRKMRTLRVRRLARHA